MRKNTGSIPVNKFGDDNDAGITIEKIALDHLPPLGEWEQPERHDRHSFFLVQEGSVTLEIDFQRYDIQSPAIIYMHPDQVHRIIGFKSVTVIAWAIDNDNLNPGYLKLLEDMTPAAPLQPDENTLALLLETTSLCIKIASRKKDALWKALLKDSSNLLIGIVVSLYLATSEAADTLSRADVITKAFREALSHNFIHLKHPSDYAEKLNLSAPYLNECVKSATGFPVSYHIQHRVILEAKRLLYHSDESLKEIAAVLGYDDYPYFSRLFTKVAGVSPATFRSKNHD
ncbi:MAG: helix-turn-helix domain-containing protein [Mucilaginibacter sp.]|nr:helix-turn-helix domain-containing protein [Mucilaginibacter sp.]